MSPGAALAGLPGGAALDVPLQSALQVSVEIEGASYWPYLLAAFASLSTLVVGGLTMVIAPDYVDRTVDRITERPLATFGWGVLVYVAGTVTVIVVSFALILTIIGILLLFPLFLVVVVVGLAANALGYIAIFGTIVDSKAEALLLGAAAAGILSLIPAVGPIAGFVAATLGFGAMFRELIE